MTKTYEYVKIMSSLDWYLIKRIKQLRKLKGLSQLQLSNRIGRAESTIGKIESYSSRAKYNLGLLSQVAKAFECHPRDLIPRKVIPHNYVKLTFKVVKRKSRKYYKLIKEEPLNIT